MLQQLKFKWRDLYAFTIMCLALAPQAYAGGVVSSYSVMKRALIDGKRLRVVGRYAECTTTAPDTGLQVRGPDAIAGMDINNFEIFGKDSSPYGQPYIVTSFSHLAQQGDQLVTHYVKMRFFEDGQVRVLTKYYQPRTGQLTDLHDFSCRLGGHGLGGGAYIYYY
ncbi:MAG: hypothetical protein OXT67_10610 [Zetaproteobacteria bacterium]|nr:hypothetical protein [Zetaproteobacteria bacterium]